MDVKPMKAVITMLRNDISQKTDTVTRLESLVQMEENGKTHRISEAGIAKIRETSKAMWQQCPKGCGVKHRVGHPHLTFKKPIQMVASKDHPKEKKAA